ncbi:MAG: MYG1 family protein [Patescibacteria group bacterium]
MDKPTTVLAHNAQFHADDIFAVATLAHLLGGLDKINIVRTRDEEIIAQTTAEGGYVVDVGHVYDPSNRRFDHHQPGGSGARANGIPYAAFGLVWKEYGEKICAGKNSGATDTSAAKAIAEKIDQKLVTPIDADDNGFAIAEFKIPGVANYRLQEFLYSFAPTWKEKLVNEAAEAEIIVKDPAKLVQPAIDKVFAELVVIAYKTLEREIKIAADNVEGEALVLAAYEAAPDKRVIVLDGNYPWRGIITSKPEPLFVIYPQHGAWRVGAVQEGDFSFKNRKGFPASWGGLRHKELAAVSGVPDAIFCHKGLFTGSAGSKEGAIAMAKVALDK